MKQSSIPYLASAIKVASTDKRLTEICKHTVDHPINNLKALLPIKEDEF